MSTEHPERGAAHVEQATIEVREAEVYMTPGARRAAHRLAYSLVVVFVVVIGLLAASFLFQNSQVHKAQANSDAIVRQNIQLQRELRADCGWYRDVSSLPVASPPAGKPSIIVPRLISDSRATWIGRGCPGHLPAPDPSFLKWAAFYHLPVIRDGNGS